MKNEKELNLPEVEVLRLRKIEQAATAVMKAFSNSIDYNTWDVALDALEAALKEKT